MESSLQYNTWGDTIAASLQKVWLQLADFLPNFIGALIILILGILLGKAIGRLIKTIMIYTKADIGLQRLGILDDIHRLGIPGSFAGFIGGFVKWFIIVVTLLAVVDILRIEQLSIFLQEILNYLPQIVVAVLILGIGVVAGKILHTMIESAAATTRLTLATARPLAAFAKWSVITFSLMAALVQLGIATSLIQILFTGIITMLTIAGGLAFGLGGRDKAKEWLERLDKEFRGNNTK